jgi:methyl-accepting chemotaxis protein
VIGARSLVAPAALLGFVALLLVAVAEWKGGSSGRTGAATVLALATFALLVASRPAKARGDRDLRVERDLDLAFAELAGGDLVRARAAARRLPGALGAAGATAIVPIDVLARALQASSVEVAGAATGVKRIASELAAGSSEQAASVVEITAAMEELAQTAAQIAATAEAQAEVARAGELAGDAGDAAIERAVAGVERLRERIDRVAARSADLEQRAARIAGVLSLVDEIARETHLLSLSAAVEAASEPGDTGRRFAGVADEVRRLAAHSRDAAASVRRLLDEFATAIHATSAAGTEAGRETAAVLAHARDAASAIAGLRTALAEIAAAAREISAGTGEQKAASAEVVQTLREAAEVVRRIAEDLRAFSGAARGLEEAAIGVQLLAQVFRLDSKSSLRDLADRWAEELAALVDAPDALERQLENLLAERPDAECAYVFDPRRDRVAIVAQRALLGEREIPEAIRSGRGFSDRPWYRAVLAERRSTVTEVFVSLLSHERVVTAVAPIAMIDGGSERGELAVVLAIDVNLDRWSAG